MNFPILKIVALVSLLVALVVFSARFAISSSSFLMDGVMEGIQSCNKKSDCTWVQTSCCGCSYGGEETVINKNNQRIYNLLVKPICLNQQDCSGSNTCHTEKIFCDRTCKFGEKTTSKPLLAR